MKVLILAAGYGTRMYPLVKDTPKALLEINNKPLINYILDRIGSIKGLNEVIIVTNDKFYKAFEEWACQQSAFSHPITVVNDNTSTPDDRLGSIGDIDYVFKQINLDDDVLVIGSDNLFDYNINEYVQFSSDKSPSITVGLYDIGNMEEAKKFGVVSIAKDGKVESFEEKPEQPKSSLVAMCFYYLPKKSLGLIGQYLIESNKSDKAGDFICWQYQKKDVYGFKFPGFIDIIFCIIIRKVPDDRISDDLYHFFFGFFRNPVPCRVQDFFGMLAGQDNSIYPFRNAI